MQRAEDAQTKSPRGFTLIELMVAVLILAILAALAMPSAQNAAMQQRIRSAVLEVMHLVDFARVQAQSRNRAYELVVDTSARTITLNESTNTRCDSFLSGNKAVRVLDFPSGKPTGDLQHVTISGVSPDGLGNSFNLCFKPDGRVLQTDTKKPVTGTGAYGAGEARIVLQRRTRAGAPTGIKHAIVIPYNGIPVLVTGTPSS